jgi:hypothetical protein
MKTSILSCALDCFQVHEAVFEIHLTVEQGPSLGAISSLPSQEMPSILQNPKVHNRVYKNPPLSPTLRRISQVYVPPSYLFKMHFNIIPIYTRKLLKCTF